MSIDKIRNIGLDKLVTQVYDFDSLTTDELMCKFAQKINIIIEHFKYLDDRCDNSEKNLELKLQYLLGQGLEEQVAKRLLELINKGTIGKLINETLLKDINDKVDNFKVEVNEEFEQKLDKNGIVTMANMGQDVKEAFTGGAVAVVGRNSVLTENIVDNQVNQYKVDFINEDNNLLRNEGLLFNKNIDVNSGLTIESNGYVTTDFISVDSSTLYTFNFYKLAPNNPGATVIYYNSNKTIISNEFVTEFSFTTSENCKYIRISFPNYDIIKINNTFLSKDTTKTSPKLKNEYLDESFLSNNFENNFAKKNIEPLNCTFFDKVINIKDIAQFEKNKTVNPTTGGFESFSGRTILGFYDVKYVDAINVNTDTTMFLYDENKNILSSVNGGNIIKSGTVIPITHNTSNNDTRFIVIVALTVADSVLNEIVINPSMYIYDGVDRYYLKDSVIKSLSNSSFYKNKKITCFGDSITAQNQWQPWVAQYFNCTMVNKGVGGTTVFNNGNKEVIEGELRDSWMCSDDRINLIPTDSDVILVFGGHNDFGYNNLEMGVLGDGNLIDSTFKSAYSLMLKKLVNKFPNALIITMTPVGGRTETEKGNSDKQYYIRDLCMTDFANAVKEVSAYYGIPCIDINGESRISTLNHDTYIADVIHANSDGGKLIANVVINGMKRFEPIIF
jgi:lysophospholipase L1-like esterase